MSAKQGGLWLAILAFGALCVSFPAQAADGSGTVPELFRGANAAQGEKFYTEMKCAACHAERMMGSTSAMYTRPDRKVHNARELRGFTQMCVTRLNRSLFPEEVTDIAAYLNQTYYHFKQ
ncbi:green heme protein [mine drainage metagenome]|jgi:cytochrome c|uniref:Green heme protein n=1 Tax=mine drainage metagenome TaxID=410659 RepID=A0A1J5Q0U7_9ZZZZ